MARIVALASLLVAVALGARGAVARPLAATSPVAFTASVPDRFAPVPGTQPGVFAFADRAGGVALIVRPLPSTIDRAPLSEREAREVMQTLAPGSTVRLEHARTMEGGLEVPLLIARGAGGDVMAVVTLPSVPRAIQLTATAGPGDEAAAVDVARAVAASFRAPTNWLSDAQLARRRAAYGLLIAAWCVLLAYGAAWFTRLRARPASRAHAAWMGAAGASFVATAALLATVPRGASAILPWMPGAMGVVLLANAAMAFARQRAAR